MNGLLASFSISINIIELDTNEIIDSRLDYIHNNPVNVEWVERPERYLYRSTRNYSDLEELIGIDLI